MWYLRESTWYCFQSDIVSRNGDAAASAQRKHLYWIAPCDRFYFVRLVRRSGLGIFICCRSVRFQFRRTACSTSGRRPKVRTGQRPQIVPPVFYSEASARNLCAVAYNKDMSRYHGVVRLRPDVNSFSFMQRLYAACLNAVGVHPASKGRDKRLRRLSTAEGKPR